MRCACDNFASKLMGVQSIFSFSFWVISRVNYFFWMQICPPENISEILKSMKLYQHVIELSTYYFGGARSKGFATLRNVSKLHFFDKIGQAKSVGFRFYSTIWRSESRISSRYLEITSISLIYSLTFSKRKELLFWLSRGLNRLTCDASLKLKD